MFAAMAIATFLLSAWMIGHSMHRVGLGLMHQAGWSAVFTFFALVVALVADSVTAGVVVYFVCAAATMIALRPAKD